MIDSLKHPLIETIRNLKGSHQQYFIIDNPLYLQWLMASNNPQYSIEFVLFTDENLLKQFPLPKKFMVKSSIIHHITGKKLLLMAYVKINYNINFDGNIVILDNVVDYGNMGSIVRNSYMMGTNNFIFINDFNIFHNKVIDSSRGLIFFSNIIVFKNIEEGLKILESYDYHLIITNFQGNGLKKINDKWALLLGNETNGYNILADNYPNKSYVTIPMKINDQCDSMNVAAIGAIIVYFHNN